MCIKDSGSVFVAVGWRRQNCVGREIARERATWRAVGLSPTSYTDFTNGRRCKASAAAGGTSELERERRGGCSGFMELTTGSVAGWTGA